jgi:hypothetical protein
MDRPEEQLRESPADVPAPVTPPPDVELDPTPDQDDPAVKPPDVAPDEDAPDRPVPT